MIELLFKHVLLAPFRSLMYKKTRTLISILCVAVGLLFFSLCCYYYEVLSLGHRYFDTYERMAVVQVDEKQNMMFHVPQVEFDKLGKEALQAVARYRTDCLLVENENGSNSLVSSNYCNADYFTVFPTSVVEGNLCNFGVCPDVAVVTTDYAKQYNDGKSPLGLQIRVEDKKYTIGAVVEPYPTGANEDIKKRVLFLPIEDESGNCIVLLHCVSDLEVINKRIKKTGFMKQDNTWFAPNSEFKLALCSTIPQDYGAALWVTVIGGLILVIALVNYFSFSIGAFVNRMRELALRRMLGAKTLHLFGILFGEQLIVLLLSGALTLILSESVLSFILNSLNYEMERYLWIDIPVLLQNQLKYLFWIILFSAVLSYVVVVQMKYNLQKEGLSGRQGKGRRILRFTSLVIQFIFTLVFLTGVVALNLQMNSYSRKACPQLSDQEKKNLIVVPTRYDKQTSVSAAQLCQRFQSKNWCESVSMIEEGTLNIGDYYVIATRATDAYFEQLKLEKKHQPGSTFAYVSPEVTQKIMRDTVFSTIKYKEKEYPIIGNCNLWPRLEYVVPYMVLLSLEDEKDCSTILLKLKSGADRKQVQNDIQALINPYRPINDPYELESFYDQQVTFGVLSLKNLFVACTAIALIITILGLFYSIQIDTERRQKEISIRKINGAGIKTIYWLFGQSYLYLYLIAVVVSVSFCLFLCISARKMVHFDYLSPILWVLPCVITAVVITITIGWRIYRIARVQPASVLKDE